MFLSVMFSPSSLEFQVHVFFFSFPLLKKSNFDYIIRLEWAVFYRATRVGIQKFWASLFLLYYRL